MIIRFPTGFYRDVIPQDVGVPGNTTFIISNTSPPRTNLTFPKIPTGVVLRQRDVIPTTLAQRRVQVGELIFTVSSAKRLELGNNSRQYELGDILDFTTGDAPVVDPMLVNEVTEIRHDTNMLDNASMGLSDVDTAVIMAASIQAQAALTDQLNVLKQQRADTEQVVTTQQKIINETNKTISALQAIQLQTPSPDVAALIDKLTARQVEATSVRDQAISSANDLATQADNILTQLRAVAVVVK